MELKLAEFQRSIKGKETVLEKSVNPFVDLTQNAMGNGEQNSVSNSIMGNMIQKKFILILVFQSSMDLIG